MLGAAWGAGCPALGTFEWTLNAERPRRKHAEAATIRVHRGSAEALSPARCWARTSGSKGSSAGRPVVACRERKASPVFRRIPGRGLIKRRTRFSDRTPAPATPPEGDGPDAGTLCL